MRKLSNNELNRLTPEEFKKTKKIPLIVVLDNIRSQHNIGAVFRTCDAFLIECIYLCGITAQPPSAEIHKAALGAEFTVNWIYHPDTSSLINELKANGYKTVAIEQTEGSIMLNKVNLHKNNKYAIVFGNEINGIQQEVVDLCDIHVEIPQYGTKHSLNISVAAGIILWEFFKQLY